MNRQHRYMLDVNMSRNYTIQGHYISPFIVVYLYKVARRTRRTGSPLRTHKLAPGIIGSC